MERGFLPRPVARGQGAQAPNGKRVGLDWTGLPQHNGWPR